MRQVVGVKQRHHQNLFPLEGQQILIEVAIHLEIHAGVFPELDVVLENDGFAVLRHRPDLPGASQIVQGDFCAVRIGANRLRRFHLADIQIKHPVGGKLVRRQFYGNTHNLAFDVRRLHGVGNAELCKVGVHMIGCIPLRMPQAKRGQRHQNQCSAAADQKILFHKSYTSKKLPRKKSMQFDKKHVIAVHI